MSGPMRRRVAIALLAAALTSGLAGCGSGGETTGAESSSPQIADGGAGTDDGTDGTPSTGADTDAGAAPAAIAGTTAVALDEPTSLVIRPGDDDLWVSERAGRVRRLTVSDDGRTLRPDGNAVLDITDATTIDAERGLLSIAFSADGDTLYVSSTDPEGDTRLDSYAVAGDVVDEGSRTELLAVDQPYANHNGGNVVLGPDGQIWFGLGDGGAGDDPENRAQDPDTVLGKIVRLDPADPGGDPEIVVSGVRNPWRFSFDTDGSLWIGDVGQNAIEEVDHLPAGEIDGANLGWSGYEGREPYLDGAGRRPADAVPPIFQYSHDGGNCSISGGFVYRGEALAGLQGAYLFADYCAGRLRAVRLADDGSFAAEYDLGVDVVSPVAFAAGADGEPYVLSGGGTIVHLVPAD